MISVMVMSAPSSFTNHVLSSITIIESTTLPVIDFAASISFSEELTRQANCFQMASNVNAVAISRVCAALSRAPGL